MKKQIVIQYFGHSCFRISYEGYEIVIDPYAPYVPGYPELQVTADQVICSHEHQDHNYTEAVELVRTGKDNPFLITQFDVPHDEADGTLRGRNMITILEAGDFRIVHFGDVGCMPDETVLEAVRGADAVMIPVGGFYTIGAEEANELADKIGAQVVIPMHYRIGEIDFPVLAEVQEFLNLRSDVVIHEDDRLILSKEANRETAVLTYVKE